MPAEDAEGGRGGRIAGMQDNSVFLLPGGRLLVAPRPLMAEPLLFIAGPLLFITGPLLFIAEPLPGVRG